MSEATDLCALGASALSEAIHAGRASCLEVMDATLARIAAVNPRANAIVSLRDGDALRAEARARDGELAQGHSRGWMHGMPHAVKDLAPVRGLPFTRGSPLFEDFVPEADALFVERLRGAGAILIGKTNVPEFGLGSNTFNPVFGATPNPYAADRIAGGSSGGAAAALALRHLPCADGSDTRGSLRNPAAYNNVLGLRPSLNRVPVGTDEVFLPPLGVAGPMARTTADLGRLLATLSGYDARAPQSRTDDPNAFVDVPARDLTGLRVAWLGDLDGYLPFEPGVLALCEAGVAVLAARGAVVEHVVPDFDHDRLWRAWLALRQWHIGGGLGALYRDPGKRDAFKPEAAWEIEASFRLTAADIYAASLVRSAWYRCVEGLFRRHDVLVLPSAQVFPFALDTDWPREVGGRTMDTYHRWMEVVIGATMAGVPAISLPVGFDPRGLPMGMQVIAPNLAERLLLEVAAAYEEATGFDRVEPPRASRG